MMNMMAVLMMIDSNIGNDAGNLITDMLITMVVAGAKLIAVKIHLVIMVKVMLMVVSMMMMVVILMLMVGVVMIVMVKVMMVLMNIKMMELC